MLCFFRHKNKRKHYQRSDVPFFMINLHFSILNYRTTHRKTNLLLIRNIHLGQSIQEWTKLNFLKLFHKFYWIHSWILCSIWSSLLWKFKKDSCRPKYSTSFFTLSKRKRLTNLQSSCREKLFLQWACYCYNFLW